MYHLLISFDHTLFLFINRWPHPPVWDAIALFISGVGTFGIIWLVFGIWLIYREERKDHWFWIPLLLGVGGGWFISEIVLKNIFMRLRPGEAIGAIIVGLNCCGYAFPSGHATIAFAGATVLSHKEPAWRWLWYALAVAIAFSRIYLGKHYPSDVIAGALVGLGIGWFALLVEQNVIKYRHAQTKRQRTTNHRGQSGHRAIH